MCEENTEQQAFFCSFGVFQNIVALEKRHLARSGQMSTLVIISLGGDTAPGADVRRLERILLEGLRTGDPVARLTAGSYIIMLTGADMENIDRELEKLLCYTMGRDVIAAEDVEAVCTEQTENRIFEMVQAITDQNQRKALDLYADLLAMKEPPMRILYLITRQFHQLLHMKAMSGQGMGKSEMAKAAGVPPFAVGKYLAQCRRYTEEQLRRAVEDCVDAEERVKTGRMGDQVSVELLIVKYSGMGTRMEN